jgi:hypothetical protein
MENAPVFLSDRNQYRGTHETFPKMEHTPEFEEAALEIAKEWGEVERLVRLAIGAADVVQQLTGTGLLTGVTDIARSVVSSDLIPSVPGPIPHAAPADLPSTVRKDPKRLSCAGREGAASQRVAVSVFAMRRQRIISSPLSGTDCMAARELSGGW